MTISAYLFEVRSIQPFLFATGKLKHMVAGSELIDYLCTQPLEQALAVCGLEGYSDKQHSPRCAGGAFYLLIEEPEKAQRFRRLWSLLVNQLLPGVEQVDALVEAPTAREAIRQGLEALKVARNRPTAILPAASPLAQRSPRTGQAAIKQKEGESLDEATTVKLSFKRPEDSVPLAQRVSSSQDVHWPNNFESDAPKEQRFPLGDGDSIAMIHIDGNGLGEVLRVVNVVAGHADDQAYIQLYRQFSDGLEDATIAACKQATDEVLVPQVSRHGVMPARPLVLGGDDVTLLVRADLGFAFTQAFVRAFEQKTVDFLKALKEQASQINAEETRELPSRLTACAGIAFIKPSQPFAQCYELAETLCDRAKKQSRKAQAELGLKNIPSSLAFHRVSASLIEEADILFDREMLVRKSDEKLALGLPAYSLDSELNTPMLGDFKRLQALAGCFGQDRLNDKRLRSLATLLHLDRHTALNDYQRWRKLAGDKTSTAALLTSFDDHHRALLGSLGQDLPTSENGQQALLADLLCYLGVVGTSHTATSLQEVGQ
ncbi:Cas10/Cmr2 second palm domain-containing protein [Halomonas sp. LS-001]